jgi:hypothetical protein
MLMTLLFFTSSNNIATAKVRMQSQLDTFYAWTKQWGLTLNLAKTKCMLFTNKQANTIPLSLDGCILEFVEQYRYLGVVLDVPWLRWEPHINALELNCIQIVNLLQSISGRQWGADHILLIKLVQNSDKKSTGLWSSLLWICSTNKSCKIKCDLKQLSARSS